MNINPVFNYLKSNNKYYYTAKQLSIDLQLNINTLENYLKVLVKQHKVTFFRFEDLTYYHINEI